MKYIYRFLVVASLLLLFSCSNDDYLNVLPRESVAIASIDVQRFSSSGDEAIISLLNDAWGVNIKEAKGIDFSSKAYVYETPDGTLGFVARVNDADELTDLFTSLAESGKCTKPEERRGNMFVTVNDSWLVGYSDDAMIVIGPITLMQRNATEQKMQRMFANKENQGAKESRLFQRLDSLESPVALVAQVSALPEQIVLPFTIGAPKEADASQIILTTTMGQEDGIMVIRGNTSSFNKNIDKKLKENEQVLQPITDDMFGSLSPSDIGFLFMNANGEELLKVLQQNVAFQALLAGANTAVDMDNIIRSVKGDMVFSLSDIRGDFDFRARLGKKDFLKDIGYWKSSCPSGSSITDTGKDAYIYKNADMSYSFAVTPDNLFVSSLRHSEGKAVEDVALQLPKALSDRIKGSRLAMMIDVSKIDNKTISDILKPVMGNTDKILYIKE